MDLISQAGDLGVIADEIVSNAVTMGRQLERGSVSSLLSKLKADGVLRFDGERYYPVRSGAPSPEPSKVAPFLKEVAQN